MKRKILYSLIILLSCLNIAKSQTNILVYLENFESGAPGVILNTSGGGSSNSGANQWIINNKYNGAPLYPNTPNENQTSGKISFAPYSYYLHICDSSANTGIGPDTIANCNYNPADLSDRFVQLPGICTLGMDSVKIVFFYTGEGSATAYAELYYSTDGGTSWITTGKKYNNQPIWKYEVVQNLAFNNQVALLFGFRWVNNSSGNSGNTSIGIDDIQIEGYFDPSVINFNVVIDSVIPNPVCQNTTINIYYHLPVPICGNGFGEVQLSDSTGYFSQTPTQLGLFKIDNQDTIYLYNYEPYGRNDLIVTIPSNTPPGKCYRIRIEYTYIIYGLDFFTKASVCIEVKHCPNTIITEQPVITNGCTPSTQTDSVCVGSVIIVPFNSWGVFKSDNDYIAELSDSAGKFPSNPNIIGTSPDDNTYPSMPPGSVGGMITETKQNPVPNGCNYYIRVVSTDPKDTGSVWGPFCIKHCDIETNHKISIQACLHSCAVGPKGFNDTIHVKIHEYNSSTIYNDTNQFEIQLLDPKYFSVVCTGCIGKITASNNTTFHIHIPCADSLYYLGLGPGVYYLRIIATSSNHPINMDGTLIFLTIGAPADDLWIWQDPSDSVFCVGDAVDFYPIPYNAGPPMNSTYQWDLNGAFFSSQPCIGIEFNGPGTYRLTVQETNYGCKGPVVPNSTKIYILGTPNASIKGPTEVCVGDTIQYSIPFQTDVFYQWTPSGGTIIDTSNNVMKIRFDVAGAYTAKILALNKCGEATSKIQILVTAHQDADFTVTPPSICNGANTTIINAKDTISPSKTYTYRWNFDGGTVSGNTLGPGPQKVSWETAGIYKVKLTVTDFKCATSDSAIVDVLQTPVALFSFKNHCLDSSIVFTIDTSQGNPNSWIWHFGDDSPVSLQMNPTHLYADSGNYHVMLIVTSSDGCMDTLVKVVAIHQVPTSLFTTKSPICEGENSIVTFTGNAPANASYTWDWSKGTVINGTGQGPYEISWPSTSAGTYTIVLSVSKNGCSSSPTTDSVDVNECIGRLDSVSNVITSNNNWFGAKGKGLKSFNVKIFDRWGVEIYEKSNYVPESIVSQSGDEEATYYLWDGTNKNGNRVSSGVYFYILNATTLYERVLPNKKGTITVLK